MSLLLLPAPTSMAGTRRVGLRPAAPPQARRPLPAPLLPLLAALCAPRGCAAQAAPLPAELSDPTLCLASGLPADLSPFLQRLDLGASPYGKASDAPLFMPLYSSHALGGALAAPDASVLTAAVFLHGLSAAANSYFCTGFAASRGRGALVVAPWHGNEQVTGAYWARNASDADAAAWSAYWTTSRWLTGGNISPGTTNAAQFTTSFDIIDALVGNITRSGLFPSLRQVSIIGFSAGSQFTSRWAFGSRVGDAADLAPSNGVPVRLFISDPGTYLFLDSTRPAAACRPLVDTGVGAPPCANFSAPAPSEVAACNTTWDEYKFGIAPGNFGALNEYMAVYDSNATARAEALARFARKDARFILGAADACNCNAQGYANAAYCFPREGGAPLNCTPDAFGGAGCCDTWPDATTSNAMDAGCEAMVQGSNRLQRGLLYVQHLNRVFPARAAGPYVALTVAGMGHNNSGLYAFPGFVDLAFAGGGSGGGGGGNSASAAALDSVVIGGVGGAVGAAALATALGIAVLRRRAAAGAAAEEAGVRLLAK